MFVGFFLGIDCVGLLFTGLKVEFTFIIFCGSLGKIFKIEMCIIFKLFFLMFLKDRFFISFLI